MTKTGLVLPILALSSFSSPSSLPPYSPIITRCDVSHIPDHPSSSSSIRAASGFREASVYYFRRK